MRFVCLFILWFCLPAQAILSPTINVPQWQCQLSASLQGNPQHFMFYGQDSWNGTGVLKCRTKSGLDESHTLAVSFSSAFDGFGADTNSTVELRMFIATYLSPASFQLRGLVKDLDRGPNIRFSKTTDLSEARIYILNSYPDSAMRSLQNGTLYVRAGEMF